MSFLRFVFSIKCRIVNLSFRLNVVLTFCRILRCVVSAFCRFEVMSFEVVSFEVMTFEVMSFVVLSFDVLS